MIAKIGEQKMLLQNQWIPLFSIAGIGIALIVLAGYLAILTG
jgi:hypothetical protein